MEHHPNELWLLYDSTISSHRKTKAMALSITKNINEYSVIHNRFSKLRWAEILNMLGMKAKDLLNKANKKYQEELAGHDFDEDSWLEILRFNPEMIKGPIAIMNNKAILCNKPKDIFKLAEYHDVEP